MLWLISLNTESCHDANFVSVAAPEAAFTATSGNARWDYCSVLTIPVYSSCHWRSSMYIVEMDAVYRIVFGCVSSVFNGTIY